MKHMHVNALFLMFAFCTSCGGQNKPASPSRESGEKYYTKYAYTDAMGKRLIIQNSFPRGGPYVDVNGKEYFKAIFWTRLLNETGKPLELKIDFPVDSYVLVPPDTMTMDKEPLYDYGMTGLKHFLDNNIHKPSALKRTINSKQSSGFYVVMLVDKGISGPFRAELSLKGQNLVYRINDKEIHCGSINLKNLKLE